MPAVLCSLHCFDVPALSTAGSVVQEFSASLDLGLDGDGCAVEVYRLQPVDLDAQLSADDTVVCRLPAWRFDLASLEELFAQVEEMKMENDKLHTQHTRTQEALVSLNACVEALRLGPAHQVNELQMLRQQLAQSERKQQETKATVLALRSEFMHLISISSYGEEETELPLQARELDERAGPRPNANTFNAAERVRRVRHMQQQCAMLGRNHRASSPVHRSSPTPMSRPSARSQGAPRYKGQHVPRSRQWQGTDVVHNPREEHPTSHQHVNHDISTVRGAQRH